MMANSTNRPQTSAQADKEYSRNIYSEESVFRLQWSKTIGWLCGVEREIKHTKIILNIICSFEKKKKMKET